MGTSQSKISRRRQKYINNNVDLKSGERKRHRKSVRRNSNMPAASSAILPYHRFNVNELSPYVAESANAIVRNHLDHRRELPVDVAPPIYLPATSSILSSSQNSFAFHTSTNNHRVDHEHHRRHHHHRREVSSSRHLSQASNSSSAPTVALTSTTSAATFIANSHAHVGGSSGCCEPQANARYVREGGRGKDTIAPPTTLVSCICGESLYKRRYKNQLAHTRRNGCNLTPPATSSSFATHSIVNVSPTSNLVASRQQQQRANPKLKLRLKKPLAEPAGVRTRLIRDDRLPIRKPKHNHNEREGETDNYNYNNIQTQDYQDSQLQSRVYSQQDRQSSTETESNSSTTSQYSSQSYSSFSCSNPVKIISKEGKSFHRRTRPSSKEENPPNDQTSREILHLHHHSNRQQQQQRRRNPMADKQQQNAANALTPGEQRGLAYTREERNQLGLLGLLPAAYQDQQLQVRGVIKFIENCRDELGRYIYLRSLKDFNERLFYAALTQHVEKLMPIVYTPTVGLGCQKFSEIYMRPRGLFVTINDLGRVSSLLANWHEKDVRVVVVTDGERILGLGDLGANGMGISIGKLSLYTALAGIAPKNVLPVTIDVGTNNETYLKDPFYIGLRQNRVRGEKYEKLIQEFMQSVTERWGRSCLIQFEDFANSTAFNLLQTYRDRYCTFNDDIQGTASVCLSGLISATKIMGKRLSDCSFLFYGAGEANLGTANLLVMAMMSEGTASEDEVKSKIWLVDSKGLVVQSRPDLNAHKKRFAQHGDFPKLSNLTEIIELAKPTAIIGASAQGGSFNESICRTMAQINDRPIIFALSNPTSKAECLASDAYKWTDGRCIYASGSPMDPVDFGGKTYITGQGNNAYIFPAVGLAAIAAHTHTIPEDSFLVAARALSSQLDETDSAVGLVYPRLSKISQVILHVAARVLEHLYAERLATYRPEPIDKLAFLASIQYDPTYDVSAGARENGGFAEMKI